MVTFLFLNKIIWCDHSLESSQRDDSNEGHIIGFSCEMRKLSCKLFCSQSLYCSPGMDFIEAYSDTCSTTALAARAGAIDTLKDLIRQGESRHIPIVLYQFSSVQFSSGRFPRRSRHSCVSATKFSVINVDFLPDQAQTHLDHFKV